MLDDGLPTITSRDQAELERRVVAIYEPAYGEGARSGAARHAPLPCRSAAVATVAAAAAATPDRRLRPPHMRRWL